jgi:hypothetical protein
VGTFKDFKNHPEYMVSETRPAKKVMRINVGSNNGYIENIYQKALILVHQDGTLTDFSIGIGKSESGNELGGI